VPDAFPIAAKIILPLLVYKIRQVLRELHLPLFEVDGCRSPEEMTELVERHFDPYLIQHFSKKKSA
jgi:hypothetical protein